MFRRFTYGLSLNLLANVILAYDERHINIEVARNLTYYDIYRYQNRWIMEDRYVKLSCDIIEDSSVQSHVFLF